MARRWGLWVAAGAITTLYLAVAHFFFLVRFVPGATALGDTISYSVLFAAYDRAEKLIFGPDVAYRTIAGFGAYLSTALIGSSIVTIIWSVVDRRRVHYARGHAVLRIYLRYLLAAAMLSYGAIKLIPGQFRPPSLIALITPFGEFTRMQVLWLFMGTSTAYSAFTGLGEVVGGLLLFWRRTTTLGALILVAVLSNVVVLNLAYEVGVQLSAMVYLLAALVLLAPDARRLVTFFVMNRPAPPAPERTATTSAAARPFVRTATFLVVLWMIGSYFTTAYAGRIVASRRSDLYGIYEIEEFTRAGMIVPPRDGTRWHRFVVAEDDRAAIQQVPGGPVQRYSVLQDMTAHELTLTSVEDEGDTLTLRYARSAEGYLLVAGLVDGDSVQARLRAMDLKRFRLRQRRR